MCELWFSWAVLTASVSVKQHRGPTHLCGEVIRALQTSSKQKGLWSAGGERRRRRRAGGRREGGRGEAVLPFHREVPGGQHGA